VSQLYIGLMSGTSMDGVDGVLADLSPGQPLRVVAHAHRPFDPALATALWALNSPGSNELHHAALAANALARAYADVVADLLQHSGLPASAVRASGAHGQTVRHRPGEFDGTGYTLQLNNPALLAELTGIDVVSDFRSRDVAAGGQGAPLVPAFHQGLFRRPDQDVAVLNLGGISNLTLLPRQGTILGFDCGPANALMDHWCLQHTGAAFDADGAWAATGQVLPALLSALLAEPFFALPPPKSTGRDLFHPAWLTATLAAARATDAAPADVQATLLELTARSCVDALLRHAPATQALLVCGGGALNGQLMRRLQALLPHASVQPTDACGLPAMQVEAAAFAWLAQACVMRQPGNLVSVTGAQGPRVLGSITPA